MPKLESVEMQHESIIQYFTNGRHAFVACDDKAVLDRTVHTIEAILAQRPLAVIDASDATDLRSFAEEVVESCSALLQLIGSRLPSGSGSLAAYLGETERLFQKKSRQGFLVINHIDCVLELQKTIEIEAPFREVMQFHDDVAIIWLGTREAVIAMHQSDRPFYLSHRIFWL